jgi:hypothetical protein
MTTYGYTIINTLVQISIRYSSEKNANEQNKCCWTEKKTVAEFEAEASRIRIVAKAEVEAESKRLQGTRYCKSKKRNCKSWV